jgi:hypothetical protein
MNSNHDQPTKSCDWDGNSPCPHGAGGRVSIVCDFCKNIDLETKIIGSHLIGGVLFVCPGCEPGLETRMRQIIGDTLWTLIERKQKIKNENLNKIERIFFRLMSCFLLKKTQRERDYNNYFKSVTGFFFFLLKNKPVRSICLNKTRFLLIFRQYYYCY